jgi:geranylgeranyl diphosphate synthase type I
VSYSHPTPSPAWDATAFRAAVSATLEEFVDGQAERLSDLGGDATRLVDAARVAVDGGKRLRAAFCYWGFRSVPERTPDGTPHGTNGGLGGGIDGEYDEQHLLRAAASLELLHASALVHDDLMDASDVRRGRPATHRDFEARHRQEGWGGGPEEYGAAAAILLGDLLLSWADELLRTSGFGAGRVLDALGYLDLTRAEVIAGQFLDVSVQARRASDVAAAMKVLRYKSAKYSVERPLHIGAALAGATPETVAALTDFGLPLGEAFQLRDDMLGVFGDPAVTGKPAGDDLVEGKRTVLVALTLEHASADDARRLDAGLGTPLTQDEVAELRSIIELSGAHARVEAMIDDLTARCLGALETAPVTEPARAALRDLAEAATQRVV